MDHDEITRDKALLMLSDVLNRVAVGDLKRSDVNKLTRALLDEVNRLAAQRKKRSPNLKVLSSQSRTIMDHEMGMMKPWEAIDLPARIKNKLKDHRKDLLLRDFVQWTDGQVLAWGEIGEVTLVSTKEALAKYNLSFGMKLEEVDLVFGPDPRTPNPASKDWALGLVDPRVFLKLPFRVVTQLLLHRVHHLRDLVLLTESAVRNWGNIGQVSIESTIKELAKYKLRFGMKPDEVELIFGPDPRKQ